jgi:hypothetical protein
MIRLMAILNTDLYKPVMHQPAVSIRTPLHYLAHLHLHIIRMNLLAMIRKPILHHPMVRIYIPLALHLRPISTLLLEITNLNKPVFHEQIP